MVQGQGQDALLWLAAWIWEQALLMFAIGKDFFTAPAKFWHILVIMYLLDKYRGKIETKLDKIKWLLDKWENER